jgi:cytochrome c oxidase cbb3-type subunit 3
MTNAPKPSPAEDAIREHTFDGIQEYDKRLPNWWLFTLYAAIVFWVGYWFYYHNAKIGLSNTEVLQQELGRIEAAKLADPANKLDDGTLWKMSRNAVFVDAGKATFTTTCVSCHKESLRGTDEGGIGPNLVDNVWIHGNKPTDLLKVVNEGVLVKGMPAWGPVIGAKKTSEVVAYVLSHHEAPAQ